MKSHSKLGIMIMEDIFRETVEPRRRQEQRDGEIVKECRTSIANLEQEPIYRTFKSGFQVERLKNQGNEE